MTAGILILVATFVILGLIALTMARHEDEPAEPEPAEPYIPGELPRRLDALPGPVLWSRPLYPFAGPLTDEFLDHLYDRAYDWARQRLAGILAEARPQPRPAVRLRNVGYVDVTDKLFAAVT